MHYNIPANHQWDLTTYEWMEATSEWMEVRLILKVTSTNIWNVNNQTLRISTMNNIFHSTEIHIYLYKYKSLVID